MDFIHFPNGPSCSAFVHGVLRHYRRGELVDERHLSETLTGRYDRTFSSDYGPAPWRALLHDFLNRVAALDRSGNESILSEEVCADNCPNFVLPNVFTPNNDGRNDFFTPFFSSASAPIPEFDNSNCPLFVERVVLSIFDRNGKTLFDYDSQEDTESGILINWDGRTNDGRELPAGVYFYSAEVTFDVLETSDDQELFNGWVQILK